MEKPSHATHLVINIDRIIPVGEPVENCLKMTQLPKILAFFKDSGQSGWGIQVYLKHLD